MAPDLWSLYALMVKSRLFEAAITQLWKSGKISGEMHLGTGEEAIIAGVVTQLQPGDAMALDHRGSAALLMRGVDPVAILRELLGYPDGLCGGMGGHMHLFSKDHLAASSGIVGAEGPAAVGFALAAQHLRPGAIAVAFFGEGALNQGMLMESMNLASVWKLPVLFVCKDDGWSITTPSGGMTGGDLCQRAQGLGVPAAEIDGWEVVTVWEAARSAIEQARSGKGPSFLRARCVHLEGHFLGLQLIRIVRDPLNELPGVFTALTRSIIQPAGARLGERIAAMQMIMGALLATLRDPRQDGRYDPLIQARAALGSEPARLKELEDKIEREIHNILVSALEEAPL